MEASAYLNFNGQCEEAFGFYARTFGCEIAALMRWADMPGGAPPGMENKVMHANLKVGATSILGSDTPPDRYAKPQNIGVALGVDAAADAERIFAALAVGGAVTMAMQQTFFAPRFGMVTDRFSIPWMVVCQARG
jgi:PhnB protein